MRSRIVPRAEVLLIAAFLLGAGLVGQRISFGLFQAGLGLLLAAAVLLIATGNIRRDASLGRALGTGAAVIGVVALVFLAGVLLVPTLASLGR